MSTIRKQSLISSAIVYAGFALGFFNTYLFTRDGGFTKEQYGLTQTFLAVGAILYSLSNLGASAYLGKFFPYYEANLERKRNDQFTWALTATVCGFTLVAGLGLAFKHTVINRVFNNSPELLRYFYWLLPFSFGLTLHILGESYAWMMGKSVLANFSRELLFRIIFSTLIALTAFGVIKSFDTFVHFYSFIYLALAGLLYFVLYKSGRLHINFRVSKVTRRLRKKIIALSTFFWSGSILSSTAQQLDKIIIAAVLPDGMAMAGIYSLGEILSSLIQAPQRAVVSATVSALSHAWREKDMGRISRIYHRTALNQLLFSTAMFCLVWLNFRDGLQTFHIQKDFSASFAVFFFLGLTRIVDMGTGVSAQIILTSNWWRFEFISGTILLAVSLVFNFFLTQKYGILGPAISNLIAYTVYNGIRYVFLWRRFGMQPFTKDSLLIVLLAALAYCVAYFPFRDRTGMLWIVLRSLAFMAVMIPGTLLGKLSPDILPVWETVMKRLGWMGMGMGTRRKDR